MKLHKVINFLRFPNINPQTKNKPLKFHKTFSQSKSHHRHKTPNDSDKETFDTTLRRGHNLDIHIPDKQRREWSYSLHAPSPPKQSERSTRQNADHRSQHPKSRLRLPSILTASLKLQDDDAQPQIWVSPDKT